MISKASNRKDDKLDARNGQCKTANLDRNINELGSYHGQGLAIQDQITWACDQTINQGRC